MHYLKSLFFNILIVFLSLHIFAGVEVTDTTKLPHIGGDLFFAAGLGLLNSLVYPIAKAINPKSLILRIFFIAFLLNFAAYALLKLLTLGINVHSLKGYLMVSLVASLGSFIVNCLERKMPSSSPPPEVQQHISSENSESL